MELNEKSLKNILQEQREEFTTHVDKKIEEQREEFQRSVGVIAEDFRHDMAAIGEQYTGIKETLNSHTEMIVSLKEDMEIVKTDVVLLKEDMGTVKTDLADAKKDVEIIKTDIEFIKGGLKKKVDYEEFEALEKRLTLLESKMHHLKQNHA